MSRLACRGVQPLLAGEVGACFPHAGRPASHPLPALLPANPSTHQPINPPPPLPLYCSTRYSLNTADLLWNVWATSIAPEVAAAAGAPRRRYYVYRWVRGGVPHAWGGAHM